MNNNEAESAANATETEDNRAAEGGAAEAWLEQRRLRTEAVASANAAGLLCDLVLNGCAGDACTTRYEEPLFHSFQFALSQCRPADCARPVSEAFGRVRLMFATRITRTRR